jgi:hypothetical protein
MWVGFGGEDKTGVFMVLRILFTEGVGSIESVSRTTKSRTGTADRPEVESLEK